ncbi:hypothetical protein [Olsenella sp. Marseille-QA0557]|uniref:hypothetical protein n=1 Tax=Olsenella sp. Marseille-QA0557 TaxID=3378782 RepID=UPI003D121F0B
MIKLARKKTHDQQLSEGMPAVSKTSESQDMKDEGTQHETKSLLPYILSGIAVGVCLLIIGTAGLVAYDRATNPIWHPEEESATTDSADQDAATDEDASSEEGEASTDAATTDDAAAEAVNAEEATSAEQTTQHAYECDYYYVDVSDAWKDSFEVEEQGGEGNCTFSISLDGGLLPMTTVAIDQSDARLSGHQEDVGTTSDGHTVTLAHAATPFITGKITPEGGATITLK